MESKGGIWVKASERPLPNKWVLLEYDKKGYGTLLTDDHNNNFIAHNLHIGNGLKIVQWAYIDESLPPSGKGDESKLVETLEELICELSAYLSNQPYLEGKNDWETRALKRTMDRAKADLQSHSSQSLYESTLPSGDTARYSREWIIEFLEWIRKEGYKPFVTNKGTLRAWLKGGMSATQASEQLLTEYINNKKEVK
jgi:hypothetical protein